jgi:hypothetical protein
LSRLRWWLLITCLAAVAIGVIWWQLSSHGRFTREQYDRIRLGMTPAEVASCIGSGPSPIELLKRMQEEWFERGNRGLWENVWEESRRPFPSDKMEVWFDESS